MLKILKHVTNILYTILSYQNGRYCVLRALLFFNYILDTGYIIHMGFF